MEKLLSSELETRIKAVRYNIAAAAAKSGRESADVRLLAVTKHVPAETINAARALGIDLIGENREQSLGEKYGELERCGLEIHFIGHLQKNKAKSVIKMASCVQSLDSIALAAELERQCVAADKSISAFIEVNIGKDPNKSGIDPEALAGFIESLREYRHLSIDGLMTILPFGLSDLQNERYFSKMHELYVDIRAENRDNIDIHELSMGMSLDYMQAVKHGSTIVRIGTALFSLQR